MKFLLTAVFFCCQAGGILATDKCPSSHPYAYYNGQHCCASDTEKTYEPQGTQCDGSKIQLDSLCCLNDQHTPCPGESCTNADKWDGKCPDSHPYAYYNGQHCCKAGIEKTNAAQGTKCDGSPIQLDSLCCLNDEHTPCPGESCTNSDKSLEKCPDSHPYAYYGGQYCCASDTEKTYAPQGTKCDGSKIQFDSLCCLNDQHYKCPSGNCYTAENLYDSCIPYTEEACIAAGMNLGLEIGSDFNAGPSTNKGCYAYNNKNGAHGGKVFFGASDNIDELAAPIKEEDQFRPIGHDCKKPNIIFLMADDMGYNDIGYNNPHAKTPKMDQLAKDGITLKQNYVQTMCTPSRISFLSGMYPYHVGRQENVLFWGSPTGLSLNRSTIGDGMKKLGYDTYAMGKWHVGDCHPAYLPGNRGFDQFYGLMGAMEDYVLKRYMRGGFTDWWDTTEDGELKPIRKADDQTAFETHSTYLYQARIDDILSKYQDDKSNNPFFMFLAMQLPHTPFDGANIPDEYRDRISSEAFKDSARYKDLATYNENSGRANHDHLGVLGLTSMLDDLAGNVIQSLKDKGLYENTIFVFSSDNGGMSSAQVGNYPYKGFKTVPTEGGTKVPGFIHSPLLPTTEDFSGMNHVTDWYPTFMRLGGEPKAYVDGLKFDGVDQLETLFGGQGKKARTQMVYNIRNQHFWNDFHHGSKISGWIRDGDFKYGQIWVYDSVRFDILYDLKNDPYEKYNVAFEHLEQIKIMSDMFDDLKQSMVPADEPTCLPGGCTMPPLQALDGVTYKDVDGKQVPDITDAFLKEGWCGNPDVDIGVKYTIMEGREVKTVLQWPLYYDPCTSGPCSTK